MTIDDTWLDTLFHLGQISADEAKRHRMRNMLITALGMNDFDSNQEETRAIDVYHGDRYLLASNGLTNVVDEDRLLEIIRQNNNRQMAAEMLMQKAIAVGTSDDVICIVFNIQRDLNDEAAKPSPTIWQRMTSLLNAT